MESWIIMQASYLIRILAAALCGAAIGFERQNRLKNAGIRTHIIVSVTSAMMMIVSKYGFSDVLSNTGVGLDPSRIAAGVVTAVGFLGVGIIFVHKQTVSGLTTAAGIWATVGIGMTVGAGMYMLGISSALLIIIVQLILNRPWKFLKSPTLEKIVFSIQGDRNPIPEYLAKFKEKNIEIINTNITRKSSGAIEVKLYVRFPDYEDIEQALQMLMEDPDVKEVECNIGG